LKAFAVSVGFRDSDSLSVLTRHQGEHKLLIQPVGAGDPRELPTPGLVAFSHAVWSDDAHVRIPEEGERDSGMNVKNVLGRRLTGFRAGSEQWFRREGERIFALPRNRFHLRSGMISTGAAALDTIPAQ
jgi:hypothetical protein